MQPGGLSILLPNLAIIASSSSNNMISFPLGIGSYNKNFDSPVRHYDIAV